MRGPPQVGVEAGEQHGGAGALHRDLPGAAGDPEAVGDVGDGPQGELPVVVGKQPLQGGRGGRGVEEGSAGRVRALREGQQRGTAQHHRAREDPSAGDAWEFDVASVVVHERPSGRAQLIVVIVMAKMCRAAAPAWMPSLTLGRTTERSSFPAVRSTPKVNRLTGLSSRPELMWR